MSDSDKRPRGRDPTPMTQSQSQSATGGTGAAKAPPTGLLSGYQRSAGAFDELLAKDGEISPHYTKLIGELEAIRTEFAADTGLEYFHRIVFPGLETLVSRGVNQFSCRERGQSSGFLYTML